MIHNSITPTKHHKFDAIVVGAGGAGLMASLNLSKKGLNTACISKVSPTRSHTVAAKGGINAALGNITDDNWRWHMYDTIRGSDWLADQDAVAILCEQAPNAIRELEKLGVPFSRNKNGKLDQRIYGGQSTNFGKGDPAHRACYAADRTGHTILHTLYQQSLKHKTRFFVDYFVLDLIFENDACHGVLALNIDSGEIEIFQSHMIIIATGGHGQIYQTTTSSSICSGDGSAMVARAGLPLKDMEFVQFHPTGLHNSGLLVTEAARAEGAVLINGNGERFMEIYAPKYKELAARDVISRAISQEIKQGRGAGENKDHVLLDLTHINKERLHSQLPEVYELVKKFMKINIENQAIPVLPSTHYMMGGIPTNANCEVLDIKENPVPGLMAIGEAACSSVHGANRLGCNSLLDLIVFAKIASEQALNKITAQTSYKNINTKSLNNSLDRINKLISGKSSDEIKPKILLMQETMDKFAGVYRNEELLKEGKLIIDDLYRESENIKINNHSMIWNNNLIEALQYQNLVVLANLTISSALLRTESRGSHFRQDFPNRDDNNWLCHSYAVIDDKEVKLTKTNVRIDTKNKHQDSFPPEGRHY